MVRMLWRIPGKVVPGWESGRFWLWFCPCLLLCLTSVKFLLPFFWSGDAPSCSNWGVARVYGCPISRASHDLVILMGFGLLGSGAGMVPLQWEGWDHRASFPSPPSYVGLSCWLGTPKVTHNPKCASLHPGFSFPGDSDDFLRYCSTKWTLVQLGLCRYTRRKHWKSTLDKYIFSSQFIDNVILIKNFV